MSAAPDRRSDLPMRHHNPPLHRMGPTSAISYVELAVMALGYLFALAVPWLLVPPGASTAPGGRVALAFGLSMLGVVVALAACSIAYRRTRNWEWLAIGIVPSMTLIIVGIIMAATKG